MASRAVCDRCGLDLKYSSRLNRHKARKTPCDPILEVTELSKDILDDPDLANKKCRFCGRVFASYTGMRRHVRDTCRIAPNKKNGEEGMELLYEHTLRKQMQRQESALEDLRAQNEEIRAQNSEMMAMMQQLVPAAGASPGGYITQGGQGNVQHVQQTNVDNRVIDNRVIVNIFGREDASHITRDQVKEILDGSLQQKVPEAVQQAVLKTALLIYSDPSHPENLTCFLPNKKTGDALVHVSRGGMPVWEIQPYKLVVSPMAQKGIDALFDNQPFENADAYEALMADLRDNEQKYAAGADLKPVLVRNKDLLARALGSLPKVGAD